MSTKIASIETNPYNKGHLAGKYASKNLSDAGILTNVMLGIPVRYKLSQKDNTVTLHKGSTITVMSGLTQQGNVNNEYISFAVDLQIEVPSIAIGKGTTEYRYLCYNSTQGKLIWVSSKKLSKNPYGITFNITQNVITSDRDGAYVSLPLGFIGEDKQFKAFTSVGFYDTMVWGDKGVNALIADGRSPKYTLQTIDKALTELSFTDLTKKSVNECVGYSLMLSSAGEFTVVSSVGFVNDYTPYEGENFVYSSNDNYIYDSAKNIIRAARVSFIDIEAGSMVANIYDYNVYKQTSFEDIKMNVESDVEAAVDKLIKQLDDEIDKRK